MINVTSKELRKLDNFKDEVNELLDREVMLPDNEYAELLTTGSLRDKAKVRDILIATQIKKAIAGDNGSFVILRDTAGEKPVDEVREDTTVTIVMSDEAKRLGE